MTESLATRVEQSIAFGRSRHWITSHLGCSEADIDRAQARIEAAHRGDNAAWCEAVAAPAAPAVIRELVDAVCPPLVRDQRGRVVPIRHRTSGTIDAQVNGEPRRLHGASTPSDGALTPTGRG